MWCGKSLGFGVTWYELEAPPAISCVNLGTSLHTSYVKWG